MTRHRCLHKLLTFGFLWLVVTAVPAAEPQYTLGVVPQNDAGVLHTVWEPIAAEIRRRSGIDLRIVSTRSIGAFEREFEAGAYDFAYLNPYHALVALRLQGYLPLVRDTAAPLTGVIVARQDSPLHGAADLAGQRVAFPSPNAFGAALVPRADLARRGIEITPWYVGTHGSVYLNVALGLAPAGGGILRTLEGQPLEVRQALRVIYETPPMPTHPIVAHPRVGEAVRTRLTQALLALGQSERGRRLLAAIPIEHIGPATAAEYKALESLGLDDFYVRD